MKTRYGFAELTDEELTGWVTDICNVDPAGMTRAEMLAALKAATDRAGEEIDRRDAAREEREVVILPFDRFVTLRRADGSEMNHRVSGRFACLLNPTQAGEPRGKWLADHWRYLGYETIEGEPIAADAVCRFVDAAVTATL